MFSALGVSHVMRYINVRYLLTYLLCAQSISVQFSLSVLMAIFQMNLG